MNNPSCWRTEDVVAVVVNKVRQDHNATSILDVELVYSSLLQQHIQQNTHPSIHIHDTSASAMVVLVDLSDSISDPHADPESAFPHPFQRPVHSSLAELQLASAEFVRDDGRPNLNLNGFSAALSCYP